MAARRGDLTFDEMMAMRPIFNRHTEEYVRHVHQLRTILAEIGQYPPEAEMAVALGEFGNKMSFTNFCKYLSWLKRGFLKPEAPDLDTVRAFAALGGGTDRKGNIEAALLKKKCEEFDLRIDIDGLLREVDEDNSGQIDFLEFKQLWQPDSDDDFGELNASTDGAGSESKRLCRAQSGMLSRSGMGAEEEGVASEEQLRQLREYLAPPAPVIERRGSMKANRAKSFVGDKSGLGGSPRQTRGASTVPRLPPINKETDSQMGDEVAAEEEQSPSKQQQEQQPAQTARPAPPQQSGGPDPFILGTKTKRGQRSQLHSRSKFSTSPRIVATPRQPETARPARLGRTK